MKDKTIFVKHKETGRVFIIECLVKKVICEVNGHGTFTETQETADMLLKLLNENQENKIK